MSTKNSKLVNYKVCKRTIGNSSKARMKAAGVKVSDLFIDKIAYFVHPKGEDKELFANAAEVLRSNRYFTKSVYVPGTRYRGKFQLVVPSETGCLVQFDPMQQR